MKKLNDIEANLDVLLQKPTLINDFELGIKSINEEVEMLSRQLDEIRNNLEDDTGSKPSIEDYEIEFHLLQQELSIAMEKSSLIRILGLTQVAKILLILK